MLYPTNLIKESWELGCDLLHRWSGMPPAKSGKRPVASALVPIRSLGPRHRHRIAAHLMALDSRDRYLRFGYATSDAQIQRYVDTLNFERDDIFGIYNRKLELIAMAHLAHAGNGHQPTSCAEFGVSVLASARGRGYGARLFERAAMHASNAGIGVLFIHALSENAAMLSIARNAGARVERDATESEAYLHLPHTTFDRQVAEIIEEQVAQTDYRIKANVRQFRRFLAGLQQVHKNAANTKNDSNS